MLRLCAAIALSLWVVGSAYGQQAPDPSVCSRSQEVRNSLTSLSGFGSGQCNQVTSTHLATITNLSFTGTRITKLKSGDFNNLPNLQQLQLRNNQLQTLPEDIFDNLSDSVILILLDQNPFSKGIPSAVIEKLKSVANVVIDLVAVNNILPNTLRVPVGDTKNVDLEDAFFYAGGLHQQYPASSYEITVNPSTVAETQISGTHTLQITTLDEGQTTITVTGMRGDQSAMQSFMVTTEAPDNIIFRIKVFLEGAQ